MRAFRLQELYIFSGGFSPNGHKATILFEELREAYGDKFDYTLKTLDPKAKEQHGPQYSQVNPVSISHFA